MHEPAGVTSVADIPLRMATTADAALVTRLLKAFFSHEGRVVPHLGQNVEAILEDPGRGFFTLAGDRGVATTTIRISAGGGRRAEIEGVLGRAAPPGGGVGGALLRAAAGGGPPRGLGPLPRRGAAAHPADG